MAMGGDCLHGSQKTSAITFRFSDVKEDLALKTRQSAPIAPRSVTNHRRAYSKAAPGAHAEGFGAPCHTF